MSLVRFGGRKLNSLQLTCVKLLAVHGLEGSDG